MKDKPTLFLFLFTLSLTILLWFSLFDPTYIVSKNDGTSSKLEHARTLGVGENPVDIRRAVEFPDWLRSDLTDLSNDLKSSLTDTQSKLSSSERIEIVKVIGSFGSRAAFATSTVLEVLKSVPETEKDKSDYSSLYYQAILALARIIKAPESAEAYLREECLGDVEEIKGPKIACLLLKRIGFEVSPKTDVTIKNYVNLNLDRTKDTVNKWITANGVVTESIDDAIYPLCIYGTFLTSESVETAYQLYEMIFTSQLNTHVKIATLRCAADLATLKPAVLERISHLMQFDSDQQLRKEALLSLLQLGSERSLELAKAYGHKFLNGEPAPELIQPHPFRKWYLEQSNLNKD
jgi:hypothetical protein